MENFSDGEHRWRAIQDAGEPIKAQDSPLILLQIAGIHWQDAKRLMKICTNVGTIPEALRIAHFIGASNYRFLQD